MPAVKPKLGIGGDDKLDRSKYNWDGSKKNLFDKAMDFLTPKAKAASPPPNVPAPGNAGAPMTSVDAVKKRNAALNSIK
jgi:hypothetical protein